MELKININISGKALLFLIIIGILAGAASSTTVRDAVSDFDGANFSRANFSGNVTIGTDSNQIFFDAIHGRLSIGKSKPNRTLDLTGAADHAVLPYNTYWGYSPDGGVSVTAGWGFDGTNYTTATSLVTGPGEALCRGLGTNHLVVNPGLPSCSSSTEAVKINIKNMSLTQKNKLMLARSIEFDSTLDRRHRFGISAQELALIYPELIGTDYNISKGGTLIDAIPNNDGTKAVGMLYSDGTVANITGIRYEEFTSVLLSGYQDQEIRLELLEAKFK